MVAESYPKTTLVLVRHGQARASGGSYDRKTPLSHLGRRQAAALASELLASDAIHALYASPFPRAVETAEFLRDTLGLEPVVDPRLAEFELDATTIENVVERLDLLIWKPEHKSASGETLAGFCTRVATFCEEVARLHPGERVAVVSHAGSIEAKIRWALGIGSEISCGHGFEIPNASITELEHWPKGRAQGGAPRYTSLLRIGDTRHLGEMATDL